MKWSLLGLVAIGLVAAFCAAILVAYLPGSGQAQATIEPKEVILIEAIDPLKRGTVVLAEHITTRSILETNAPKLSLRDPAQVIGKVLVVSMEKGQAFTESCFPPQGEGIEVAGRLPSGMRAVSLSISDGSGLRGLLYPGSTVDILASLRSSSTSNSVSTTLLEGVQILAVGDQTVYSTRDKDENQSKNDRPRQMLVTVLVTPKQAQHLQLAMKHGTLSLALRNPTDNGLDESKEFTHLATLLGKAAAEQKSIEDSGFLGEDSADFLDETASLAKPGWQVTVIHGPKTQQVELPLKDSDEN